MTKQAFLCFTYRSEFCRRLTTVPATTSNLHSPIWYVWIVRSYAAGSGGFTPFLLTLI